MSSWQLINDALLPSNTSAALVLLFCIFSPENFVLALAIGLTFLVYLPHFKKTVKKPEKKEVTDEKRRVKRFKLYAKWTEYQLIGAVLFLVLGFKILFLLATSMAMVSSLLWLVNHYTRVSIHVATVTGGVIALTYLFGLNALLLYALIPLSALVKSRLGSHSNTQMLLGFVAGTSGTLVVFEFLPSLTFSFF